MSAEPPPSGGNAGFNPDDWTNANDPVDNQFLAANYLQFPLAQGTETLANTIVSGELTVQNNSTFADLATFNNGIDITTTAGIKFSDTTVQTTAFVEANYAQLNTDNIFLPTFTNTFNGSVNLGTNATAKTQTSGDSSTFVATTAFVQDAVQVSSVQVGDSPLLWSGANTWQLNAGTPSQLTYSYPYGISNLWNLTGGGGDCDLVCNSGTGVNSSAFRIYCTQGNKTGTEITALTPQLTLSNNFTAMQVRDGINIPSGTSYTVNGVNILTGYATTAQMNTAISTALTPYSTTTEMNTAISTALVPYSTTSQMNTEISTATSGLAPIASPTFTGLPLLTTTPTSDNVMAVANLQYVNNAISGITPISLANYAQLVSASTQTFTTTLVFYNSLLSLTGSTAINCNSAQVRSAYLTSSCTSDTQPLYTNNTSLATTAFVQQALPIYTTSSISFYPALNPNSCTFNAGTFQQFIQTNSSSASYVSFFNNPFSITNNNYTAQGSLLFVIQFSKFPFPNYPPLTSTTPLYITGQSGGLSNLFQYSWGVSGTTAYMSVYMAYNVATGSNITFSLSSIGLFTS